MRRAVAGSRPSTLNQSWRKVISSRQPAKHFLLQESGLMIAYRRASAPILAFILKMRPRRRDEMKYLITGILAFAIAAGTSFAEDTATKDLKKAGEDVKDAGKATGDATVKGTKAAAKGTEKGVKKAGEA